MPVVPVPTSAMPDESARLSGKNPVDLTDPADLAQLAELAQLAQAIKRWGRELGFADIAITDIDLTDQEPGLLAWLAAGHHGQMDYMASHGLKRARPAELVPGTLRVISARMDYLPQSTQPNWRAQELTRNGQPLQAQVALYARGRDYHKVLRQRLAQLAGRIDAAVGPRGHRVFTDSAPILETALAQKAGLGWRGKHTLLLTREAGSMFFLGEIFIDLPLPVDAAVSAHCGNCRACIDVCPTAAILGPGRLDARRCISYLTIEFRGSIPLQLRPLLGNHIYGCDDCQLVCPWNKFAQQASVPDFAVRNGLDSASLCQLFGWSAEEFATRLEGSPIRRIGYECWLRNLAVALGNAARPGTGGQGDGAVGAAEAAEAALVSALAVAALKTRAEHESALVREHVAWALQQHVPSSG